MPGFPSRPFREELGPPPVNRRPVVNPQHELGADIGALMMHQSIGSGLVADLVNLEVNTATLEITFRREAWNVEGATSGDYAPPLVTPLNTGYIEIAYPATVPDQNGQMQQLVFQGGWGSVQRDNSLLYFVNVKPTTPRSSIVRVLVRTLTGPIIGGGGSSALAAHDDVVLIGLK